MRILIPSTALLTVGVVSYITYAYLLFYIPTIKREGYTTSGNIFLLVFIVFPVLIFWVLAQMVFGDAGVVTKKLISKIYADNNIDESMINQDPRLTMNQVLEILTENYFIRQGLLQPVPGESFLSYSPDLECQPLSAPMQLD